MTTKFSDIAHNYELERSKFDDSLLDADPNSMLDWTEISTDSYDNSIELHSCPQNADLVTINRKSYLTRVLLGAGSIILTDGKQLTDGATSFAHTLEAEAQSDSDSLSN